MSAENSSKQSTRASFSSNTAEMFSLGLLLIYIKIMYHMRAEWKYSIGTKFPKSASEDKYVNCPLYPVYYMQLKVLNVNAFP